MSVSGTSPPISIDFGKDEPGMTLQLEVKRDQLIDYEVDGEVVKSPVDIDELPFGVYQLRP